MHRRISLIPMLCCWLLVAPFLSHQVAAQQPQIRVKVHAEPPFWVGQQLTLAVTLLVPGYFASATSFDLPDPAGVLLMPPQEHPVVGNETVDGVLYTTQQHELQAWPMRAGEQQIPPLTVRFAYKAAPLDPNSISASLNSRAIPVKVEQPPGTEGMGTVISARNLSVKETWEPEIGSASVEAGAAFTRRITFSAPDVPGMIFPTFPTPDIDGLGVYSRPRVTDDNDQRGGFVGERQEVITYVAKRPGQYTIPAAEFRWFDLDSKQVKTQTFAAHTLAVVPNPSMASGAGLVAGEGAGQSAGSAYVNWGRIIYAVLALMVLLYLSLGGPVQGFIRQLEAKLRPRHLQPLHPRSTY